MKQKRAQLAALGEWTHIDCLKRGAHERIQDEILASLLFASERDKAEDTGSRSNTQSLLDAVDLDKILNESRPAFNVREVPGGTVSFLFERGSNSSIEEEDEVSSDTI